MVSQPTIINQIQEKLIGNVVGYVMLGVVCIIAILVIYYYISKWLGASPLRLLDDVVSGIQTAVYTLKGAKDRGIGVALGCGVDETYRAGLCYKSCRTEEDSDGTQRCYTQPPKWSNGADWPGGQSVSHLQHKVIYSSVGISDTIPNGCTDNKELYASLCYDVPSNWKVTSPGFIGEQCGKIQPGFTRDDGTGCWIDAETYGRGVGRDAGLGNCPDGWHNDGLTCSEPVSCASGWDFFKKGCSGGNIRSRPTNDCNSDEEKYGALCYPKCRNGYSPSGCCTCLRPANVKYRQVKPQIGMLPDKCPNGKELRGRICYPKCQDASKSGDWPYERTDGNIENCTTQCPLGWKNIGIGGCERPSRDIGMGKPIHTCAPGMVNEAGLCYHPCTDIQSVKDDIKMNVGRTYTGIGPTCFPNL